jgi:molecular chaperone DnaK
MQTALSQYQQKIKVQEKNKKITIQASGGLSDDEIDNMVREAEENAEADKEKKDLVEAKNQAESLIHSTEKSIQEHADKVDPTTVEAIELSIKALQETLESDDPDKIRARSQDVTEAAMKLGEAIYKSEAENNPDQADASNENNNNSDEDIFDADFEDLTDEKK